MHPAFRCFQRTFYIRILLLLIIATLSISSDKVYNDQFVAYIDGDPNYAKHIAQKHGFIYLGEIFEHVYHLKHKKVAKRSTVASNDHSDIQSEDKVIAIVQQTLKRRVHRDYLRSSREPSKIYFNDNKWPQMWYLRQIVTTDLHHGCTDSHTGTSASAPLAAGICALSLEAKYESRWLNILIENAFYNSANLTWRDMQHIVVMTSRPANLHAKDWKTNGVGRNVSHSFGYGLLDANAMVNMAREWVTVPPQKVCEVQSHAIDKLIPAKSHVELSLTVHCDNVRFLEHVQAKVTLSATRRGDIHIYLTSPAGTRSTLLAQRPMDTSRSGFQNWPFMSVHTWGEDPDGEWKLEVHNDGRYYNAGGFPSLLGRAYLKEWTVVLYGTTENPDRRRNKSASTSFKPSKIAETSLSHSSSASTAKSSLSSVKYTTQKLSFSSEAATKGTITPLITHNDIEDIHAEIALADSEKNSRQDEEGFNYHGTRTDKSNKHHDRNQEAIVNGGCAFSQSQFLCLGLWIVSLTGGECEPGFLLLNGRCVKSCPDGYFAVLSVEFDDRKVSKCFKCHYSCKRCKGPNDSHCTDCYADAELHHNGYCNAKELVQEVIALEKWYTAVTVIFLCLCFLILVLVIYIVTDKNPHLIRCCVKSSSRRHQNLYDGLPLRSEDNESAVLKLNIINNKNRTFSSSAVAYRDDNSEDDL
ncbi:Furin-like protease 1: isoforms 1/1-X/2 [Dinothrombium tinctorium]|uniref:Furin-like protease 1: isoforms 1/1-X/2 n=1 Tax=Dinothrombium tinctorium TaxID=1965070 RepID=A0A3S3P148_9ACAR|nr:Furin-like protease 1: isoforms 1/1-X/2 [Dinothrombium tinctorium]RWS09841.1 Furin-like protease 1: isoforms 1/1-X/2 [Dinothrombium tinctorium]RWS10036.1 Furin-like protease 1: isoforms 1/1-X/2 [Dinothrombium tinctorium]